jgi:regulator of telomere elongation helicase 1
MFVECDADGESVSDLPTVIYSSRTHSQLSQVINEMKKTVYRPNVVALGSRDQMCLNPKVASLPTNTAKNTVCRHLNSERACEFRRKTDELIKVKTSNELLDIEEIIELSKRNGACPYYYTRERNPDADFYLVPYNYLVEETTRKSQNIKLQNSIVIFDEAHNVESSCSSATSTEISLIDISLCIDEINVAIKLAETESDSNINDIKFLKLMMVNLERIVKKYQTDFFSGTVKFKIKDADFLFDMFAQVNVKRENIESYREVIEECINLFTKGNICSNQLCRLF